MLKDAVSHIEFQSFLITKLLFHYFKPHFKKIVINRADIVYKVFFSDFTPVREILKSTYNPRGETPWDPVLLFRSYWLMCQYGDKGSLSKWVATLAQASRHDSVVLPYALYEMKLLNPEFNIDKIVLDGAHDNCPTYELLEQMRGFSVNTLFFASL